MDIISMVSNDRRYNFHSHTQFCDGRAAMEAFAKAAVDAGFTHYGFSPHSPLLFPSPCNMHRDNVKVYLGEVARLQQLYEGRIRFYAAMEIDYIDNSWGPASDYFKELPLDYRIGSVHFIPSDEGPIDIDGHFESFRQRMERYFHNDIRHVVESFYEQSMRMLQAGGFDIIGHFDKIGHNAGHFRDGIEDELWYKHLVNGLIDAVIDKGVIVEINTKAWREHHRMFPGERYLKRLADAGVPMVVNSDAHVPALINAGREEAFDMLDALSPHNKPV